MSYFVTIKNEKTGIHYGVLLNTITEVHAFIGTNGTSQKRSYTKRKGTTSENILKVGRRKVGRPPLTKKRGPGRPKGYSPKKATNNLLNDLNHA